MTDENSAHRGAGDTSGGDPPYACAEELEADPLGAALAGTTAGILVIEQQRVVFANAAVSAHLGFPPDDAIGLPITRFIPEESLDEHGASETTVDQCEWTGPVRHASGQVVQRSISLRSGTADGRVVATITDAETDAPAETADEQNRPAGSPVGAVDDVAVIGLDADATITAWNDGAENLLGWSPDDILETDVSVLYPSDLADAELPAKELATARIDGSATGERWWVRADGSTFWGEATITPTPDGFRLVIRDRTKRKRITDERQLLATISHRIAEAETFDDGVETALETVCERTEWAYGEAWTPAANGDYLEQTAAHAERAELEPFLEVSQTIAFRYGEGLPGRVWESKSHEWIPDASAEPRDVFHRAEFAEEVGLRAALGVPITTDDGVVAILTFFLQEAQHTDYELVTVVSDVATDLGRLVAQKRVEEALERERTLLDRIFATSPIGLFVTAIDGTILRANRQAGDIYGLSDTELIDRKFETLIGAVDDERESPIRRAVSAGESIENREFEVERADGETVWVSMNAAPMLTDDGVDRVVVAIEDITDQKRKERTLRRQRNTLERIKGILESLRPINRELAHAETREEITRLVCEQVASSEAYLFAWIGEYNSATGTITPREWAGIEAAFVDEFDVITLSESPGTKLFEQAIESREVQALQQITTDPVGQQRRSRAIEYGYQSMAVVPVVYGETVFGVITVYSARPDAFDSYERGLVGELGDRIGHAINAAENKQLLHTDRVVELEFEVSGSDSVFTAVAATHDCHLSLTTVAPTTGTGYLCYVEVAGGEPETVATSVADRPAVESARVVRSHGESGVLEVVVRTGPIPTLVEHGTRIQRFRATGSTATLIGETRPGSDIETIISEVEGRHDETVFTAKRTLDQSVPTMKTTKNAVETALTDRQQEVLSLAYHAGYFKSPRDSTGEELATALGITSPTFYTHTRKGIQQLLNLLVADLEPTPRRFE